MQKRWLFACGAGILITILFWADLLKPLDALWTGVLLRMRNSMAPLRTNQNIVIITAPSGGEKALTIEEQALLGEKSKVSSLIGSFMEKAHPAVVVILFPVRAADPAFQGQDFILFPGGRSKKLNNLYLERSQNSPGITAYVRHQERLGVQGSSSWPSPAYQINYRGLPGKSPFTEYSILDVIQDQLAPSQLTDKVVFMADPVSRNGVKTPIGNLPLERVEAQICANLLQKDFLVRADRIGSGQLAIPVLILLLSLGFPFWGPLERFGRWTSCGCLGGIMVGG
ncbi:MAG: hypothetical protein HYU64_15385, partial [Armatimonadetes bacterium]|nr:hypothetical protein [Armatimonadota bacterium]